MIELGMLVLVFWPQVPEYHMCKGTLTKMEYIEETKETITVLKNVVCKEGPPLDYIVGIKKDKLRPSNE